MFTHLIKNRASKINKAAGFSYTETYDFLCISKTSPNSPKNDSSRRTKITKTRDRSQGPLFSFVELVSPRMTYMY